AGCVSPRSRSTPRRCSARCAPRPTSRSETKNDPRAHLFDGPRCRALGALPSPPELGLARLAQEKTRPGQARGAWGRAPTTFTARTSPTPLRISKVMTASVSVTRTISFTLNGEKGAAEIKPHHNRVAL